MLSRCLSKPSAAETRAMPAPVRRRRTRDCRSSHRHVAPVRAMFPASFASPHSRPECAGPAPARFCHARKIQQRIDIGNGHALGAFHDPHDLVPGFDLTLLQDAKIKARPAMRHNSAAIRGSFMRMPSR